MTTELPKLGIFWGIAFGGQTAIAALWQPWTEVPDIGGFRTLDIGHVDYWQTLQQRDARLRGIEYEEFPRGRINYRAGDERFLLLADRKLLKRSFIDAICRLASLPKQQTLVMSDPHYRSTRQVAPLAPAG